MLSPHDPQVQDYLRRLDSTLRRLPPQERAGLHAELREHLNALIAAHVELGASPTEAVDAALRQFGDPVKIGKRLTHEWAAAHGRGYPSFRRTALLTLLWAGSLVFTLFHASMTGSERDGVMLAPLPLLIGLLSGAVVPARPVRTTLLAAASAVLIVFGTAAAAALSAGGPMRVPDATLTSIRDAFLLLMLT